MEGLGHNKGQKPSKTYAPMMPAQAQQQPHQQQQQERPPPTLNPAPNPHLNQGGWGGGRSGGGGYRGQGNIEQGGGGGAGYRGTHPQGGTPRTSAEILSTAQFHLGAAIERIERIDPSTLTPEQTATRALLLSGTMGTAQSTAIWADDWANPARNILVSIGAKWWQLLPTTEKTRL